MFHSAELPSAWGNAYPLGMVTEKGQPTADALQDDFLQFARSGDPNSAASPVNWPAQSVDDDTLLSFGDTKDDDRRPEE